MSRHKADDPQAPARNETDKGISVPALERWIDRSASSVAETMEASVDEAKRDPALNATAALTPGVRKAATTATKTRVLGPKPASPATKVGVRPATPPAIDPAKTFGAGTRIEQYEIIREVGRGGMGAVYLARDTKLGRLVAIKFISATHGKFVDRFLVEARATAQCNHENIVVIHEVNEYHGLPYMVLEYLEGESLDKLIKGRRMPAQRAVEIIAPVVRALVRAHEFDIIHRDLKPENIVVADSGTVKVLDFGIAKLFSDGDKTRRPSARDADPKKNPALTQDGNIIGTPPYMSPEQLGIDSVDHRSDIWAVGVMLWEMVAGRHPLGNPTLPSLLHNADQLDTPMPAVLAEVPELPEALARVIDRCLEKRKSRRYESAQAVLDDLEPLLPGRYGRKLQTGESPYPGLTAFQEVDADRFFGRSHEIRRMTIRIRDQALLGVVGPSGVGKSSFVRAGLIPGLKSSGEEWEILIIRPGRHPLDGLATMLLANTSTSTGNDLKAKMSEHEDLVARLTAEPGYMGTLLRSRARQKSSNILLFVDQFEELYTLVPEREQRMAYTACLAGVADDAATPLRVVVSMRSDFVDRAAEDPRFMDELTRGLLFLPPPDRRGLREALTQPVEMVGYTFETPHLVDEMLASLENTRGALPLLQFAATKLWETRDRENRLLTEASYEAMGGVSGTLATHADEVLATLAPEQQKQTRTIFEALVTAEGTRAIVDVDELLELSPDREAMQRLVERLVDARLLVVQSDTDQPSAEIVHESLIDSWPTLRKWLDEAQDDVAIMNQLRTASKQWAQAGKPQGLLWRGDAVREARYWYQRTPRELPKRERQFLDEAFDLADRARKLRRRLAWGTIAFLLVVVVAAIAALIWIRGAEQRARSHLDSARAEAERARAAEARIQDQLDVIKAKEAQRLAAQHEADMASAEVEVGKKDLQAANVQLTNALADAEEQARIAGESKDRAEKESLRAKEALQEAQEAKAKIQGLVDSERRAKEKLEKLLASERARVKKLEAERKKISTDLKE